MGHTHMKILLQNLAKLFSDALSLLGFFDENGILVAAPIDFGNVGFNESRVLVDQNLKLNKRLRERRHDLCQFLFEHGFDWFH